MQTDSQGRVTKERADEIPAEHSRPTPPALLPPVVDRCCCPATYYFVGLTQSSPVHILPPPVPQAPFAGEPVQRKPAPTPLQEKGDETPRSILKATRRREEALLPPFPNSTCYCLWKMFSWWDHKAGRASGPLPVPISFCVLFQAHPQLKFALKVSNFHFFQNNCTVLDPNVVSLH